MATIVKQWPTGTGSATIQYSGQGNGTIVITSDDNNLYEARSMQVAVKTTDGSNIHRTITINQAARQRTDLSNAVVTASNQTYSGSAKTPTPTVTLNGTVIPSTGYDVAYSNNANAGTATITITGKGDYTGTATGTFTINKATGSVTTAPSARDVTYTGSSQYLVTAGSGTGTMYYRYKLSTSSSWSSWSTTRPSRTNAGTYNIEYYAAASSDGNYTQSATGSLNVEMKKADASVSAAPTAKSLTYNTSAQALVNAGTASGGTMYYKYTTTNSKPTSTSGFSSSIPTRTTAGTYYVWYYVKGDSNHTDTAISSTSVSVTIAKASRTLSFVNTYMVLNTSSTGTNTVTPSAGSGDGDITYSIANTTYATINSSTGAVTSKTSDGSVTVTGTIAEGTNYLSASTTYKLYVFATIHNYSYTGSYKSVTLPPGTYKFEVWGAQGGSSAADSTHGITAKPGGNGGYSEGQLTLSTATAMRVYVGGQGSSTAGGYNGGGSTTGSSTKDSGGTLGISKMGGGGGATDIRLSSGSLYSRMIVAGGGSGGSRACKIVSTYTTVIDSKAVGTVNPQSSYCDYQFNGILNNLVNGKTYRVTTNIQGANRLIYQSGSKWWTSYDFTFIADFTNYPPSGNNLNVISTVTSGQSGATITIEEVTSTSEIQEQYGWVGGGTNGNGAYSTSDDYRGKQNAAGINGSFGQGANQTASSYRYCSAAGGGGWYGGGGGAYSDTQLYYVGLSGGGSGFVNTAASAGNRPSGYTGLQLDSGTTYAGNKSFPSTSGGTETGHSGNGYARITRL